MIYEVSLFLFPVTFYSDLILTSDCYSLAKLAFIYLCTNKPFSQASCSGPTSCNASGASGKADE